MKQISKVKFIVFSLLGLFLFFIPVTINGVNTIMVDHFATYIKNFLADYVKYYVVAVIVFGIVYSFIKGTYRSSKMSMLMMFFKVLGLVFAIMYITQIGPSQIMAPGMLPFLFDKLAISLAIIIPLGGTLLCFITGYGLMEFIGVFARPLMRPVFKTPGTSAIDAVASFVGSYSIGLLITSKQYENKKYTFREASVIATGFSTVSATFMVVVARTLNLMDMWLTYFIVTLVITFTVSAITVRLYPLRKMKDIYIDGSDLVDDKIEGNLFKNAWREGVSAAQDAKPLVKNLGSSLRDGFVMGASVTPTVLSIGLIGLIFAEYTIVFDVVGYIFYPITFVLGYSEPLLMAKAMAVSIAEMFLPALITTEADFVMRFSVAVVCVSEILFFSASIPCVLSTKIPIKLKDIIIIWFLRVILSLIIVTPIAYLLS